MITRRSSTVALAALVFAITIVLGRLDASNLPSVTITLPPNVPSERVDIRYFMTGPFGGFGGFVQPQPNLHAYQIEGAVDGKPARGMKIVVYAPGCQVAIFDLPLTGRSVLQRAFSCKPLATLVLTGKIVPGEGIRKSNTVVSVVYLAYWACDFFGVKDCLVETFSVGTAVADADGIFHIQLPDFSKDPVTSSFRSSGSLRFVLLEPETGNIVNKLAADGYASDGGNLPILPRYPESVTFVARRH